MKFEELLERSECKCR